MNLRLDNQPGLVASWHFDGNFLDLTGATTGSPVSAPSSFRRPRP